MPNPLANRGSLAPQWCHRAGVGGGRARGRCEFPSGLAIGGDFRSSGSDFRRKLALDESYPVTIGTMVGGWICVALGLVVGIAAPLVVWLSQNLLCGFPIAVVVLGSLALESFSLTQLQAART